ncbi:MAG: NAD-dependent epimerase/dehydratase family protein, partial [Patescibacteria group bacterium]
MKIAILGGSRFIGFHLARTLAEHGAHQVTLFNRGYTRAPGPLPSSVKLVIGDREVPVHAALLLDQRFDVVCDISGYSPRHVLPFLTPSHRSRIGHYVFCSTSSVYRVPVPTPHTETASRAATTGTYGGDKAAIEDILIEHWHRERWPVTIVRPQGVFGPFDASQAAFVFSRLRTSMPIFLRAGAKFRINFLFVHDLVAAFVALIGTTVSHGRTYNVAGDDAVTPHDFVRICSEVSGYPANLRTTTDWRHQFVQIGMPWLPYELVADNRAIKRDLGLAFTSLKAGLSETWTWLQAHPDQLKPQLLPAEHYLSRHQPIPFSLVATGLR